MRATLGIDLGGTSARAAVLGEAGEVLATSKIALAGREPDAVIEQLSRLASEALRLAAVPALQVRAAAVGVAGMIARGTGVVLNAPNLGWRDVPFQAALQKVLPFPVRIYNDLSVAAYGEAHLGAGRGAADVVLVFVGTGVGGGLIQGSKLHEGATGVAGELGHVKMRPGGRKCGCGELGCLEAYAGGASLAALASEGVRAGKTTRLVAGVPVSAGALQDAADAGDAFAQELLDDAGQLLGLAAANLVTLLNPARLILGGGVLAVAPRVKKLLVAGVDQWTNRPARQALTLADAALGDEAGVLGAAMLAQRG